MKNTCEALQRPHEHYRNRFYDLLMRRAPGSVLDLGCGDGRLLRRLASDGVEATGVDPDQGLVDQAQSAGLNVKCAVAEDLPFEPDNFDWVVSEFTGHHFTDIRSVLGESLRVARKGIALLDVWYDTQLAGHRTADAFDRWAKQIDRTNGMVHNPTLGVAEYISLAKSLPLSTIELTTLLVPVELAAKQVESMAAEQIEKSRDRTVAMQEWGEIMNAVSAKGFMDDGAVIVFADC